MLDGYGWEKLSLSQAQDISDLKNAIKKKLSAKIRPVEYMEILKQSIETRIKCVFEGLCTTFDIFLTAVKKVEAMNQRRLISWRIVL